MKTATQRSFIAFFSFKQEDSQSAIALHTSVNEDNKLESVYWHLLYLLPCQEPKTYMWDIKMFTSLLALKQNDLPVFLCEASAWHNLQI